MYEQNFNELYELVQSLRTEIRELKNTKKRNHIYLAGSISKDIRTYQWREEFEELMAGDPNFVVVNPCKNSFNQSLRDYEGDNTAFIKEAVERSQGILKPKDFQLIDMCSAMVVDLHTYVPSKQPLATIYELCWRDLLNMPLIAIEGDARNWVPPTQAERVKIAREYVTTGSIDHIPMENIYVKHSWVDDSVSAWVKNVPEAVALIKEFFGEY